LETESEAPEQQRLAEQVRILINELRNLASKLPLTSTLSNLAMKCVFTNPDLDLKDETTAHVEYLTWIYLTTQTTPPNPSSIDRVISQDDLQHVDNLLRDIFESSEKYFLSRSRGKTGRLGDSVEDVLESTRVSSLYWPGYAFQHHLHPQLHALFDPFKTELDQLVGFNLDDSLTFLLAFTRVFNARNRWCREQVFTAAKTNRPDLRWKGNSYEEKKKIASELTQYYLQQIRPFAHRMFIIKCDDLSRETRVDEAKLRRFMDFFSTAFGQADVGDGWPSPYEPLNSLPLLKLSDNSWLTHLSFKILWRLKVVLEHAIAQDSELWNRYESHRAKYLENHAVELISSLSKYAKGWTNLEYSFDDGKGARNCELDGLVLVDHCIFLIEAKAGRMSAAARRGSRSAIDQLERLVDDAQEQSARALRFIRSTDESCFRTAQGEIRLRRKDISRVYLISATLDSLSAFVTNKVWLTRAGIVGSVKNAWSVYDLDLEIITDIVHGVGEFASYLDRRLALENIEAFTLEETDWFGLYLLNALNPTRMRKILSTKKVIIVEDAAEAIRDYYYHLEGKRKTPSPKPRQAMPNFMGSLIDNLEREGPDGFVDAVAVLLEQTREERSAFNTVVKETRASLRKHRGIIFRTQLESGSVLCYAYWHRPSLNRLREYTKVAKYVYHSDIAVSIAETARRGTGVCVEKYSWKEDPALEATTQEIVKRIAVRRMGFQA
jgi:hypothetical protein